MRIFAIADRPPEKPIAELLEAEPVDVIVTLGDLEMSQIRSLENIDLPKLGVYGNHCSGMYMPELGIENMHMKIKEVKGVIFGGFEGCVKYKESSAKMYTQEEASAMLATLPKVDIVLAHCPPYGVNDDPSEISHTGYIGLRDYVEREQPKYLFHGHTYPKENELITLLGNTEIIYVSGSKIIEI
jgi:hypothetical protein